jgi:hypothetical protein
MDPSSFASTPFFGGKVYEPRSSYLTLPHKQEPRSIALSICLDLGPKNGAKLRFLTEHYQHIEWLWLGNTKYCKNRMRLTPMMRLVIEEVSKKLL